MPRIFQSATVGKGTGNRFSIAVAAACAGVVCEEECVHGVVGIFGTPLPQQSRLERKKTMTVLKKEETR